MKLVILVCCFTFLSLYSHAQVGIGTTTPDSSAILDITSTDGGVLIPRISLVDVTNITTPINSPATGLLVYNTNASVVGGNNEGFYYFNGTIWVKFKIEDGGLATDLKDLGVISAFPGVTYPNDMYLPLDGGVFNDVDYPEFAAFIPNLDSDVVTDNGNGTFTLSDWNNNGIFLRGQGGNAGVLGIEQNDATKQPNNVFITQANSVNTSTDGAHNHNYERRIPAGSGGSGFGSDATNPTNTNTGNAGSHDHTVNIPQLTITGGDIETRPINRSITWVIKVKPSASSVNTLTINNYTDIGTDNQIIDDLNLNGTTLEISLEDDGVANETLDLSPLLSGVSQNTLDQAYDEGGAGVGKTIIADNGSVRINGTDGFLVTGTRGSGANIDSEITGSGTRMFFNPFRAAFRAGETLTSWDNANIGENSTAFGFNTEASGGYSTAFGNRTIASGLSSTAFGFQTIASGNNSMSSGASNTASGSGSTAFGINTEAIGGVSTAIGFNTIAPSLYETVIGGFNTLYTANESTVFDINDRVFSIGNGTSNTNRSNALTIYKSGLMNINDAYNMPLTDGTANQVMVTDGAGAVSFIDAPSDNDWLEIGTGNPPNAIGDDIYTHGQVHIGSNTLSVAALDITSPNTQVYGIDVNKISNGTGTMLQAGIRSANNVIGSNPHYGVYSTISGTGTGNKVNFRALNNSTNSSGSSQSLFEGSFQGNSGTYNLYGNNVFFSATPSMTNTGSKYGYKVTIDASIPGIHYGVHSDVRDSNSYAGFFLGRTYIGTTAGNGYILPETDGTASQVLTTAGDGTTSWTDVTIAPGTLIDVTAYGPNYAAIAPATYEQPRFYIENNRVYVEGTIVKTAGTPTAGDLLFTLPVGYRPLKQRIFTGTQNGTNTVRVDVLANGSVFVLSASSINFISLDAISFRID